MRPVKQRMRWAEHKARKRHINIFVSETLKGQIGYIASSSLSSPALWRTNSMNCFACKRLWHPHTHLVPVWTETISLLVPAPLPHPRQTQRKQYKTLRLQELSSSCKS